MPMRRRLLKKLCQLGPRGAVEHYGRHADRDLVPGRSQGRPKGNPRLYLGADWIPAADGARQPPHLRLSVRRDLPGVGVGAAMIVPHANTEAMNLHLQEISTQVAQAAHAVLICDGAGWHQRGKQLEVPANLTLLSLPPYSPELNPMENVWDYLRQNKLCARVWDTYDDIVEACRQACNFLIDDPERIRSIGSREWACVSL